MIQKPINFKKDLNSRFSDALCIGDFIFLSAQLPLDPETGTLICDDFKEQARQCFRNIKALLQRCDLPLNYVLQTTVYLTEIDRLDDLDDVYAEFLVEPLPTRTVVGAASLPFGAKIQIEAYCIDCRALEVLCAGEEKECCDGSVCEL